MSGGERAKSVLKSVAIFLACLGLGYAWVLHSVAAVYEVSWTYSSYHANRTKEENVPTAIAALLPFSDCPIQVYSGQYYTLYCTV